MEVANINHKKQRRFIARGNLREFEVYIQKGLWTEVKAIAQNYDISESEVVRSFIVAGLSNLYVLKKFEEMKNKNVQAKN